LDDFSAWWLTEPSLDEGRIEARVPPRGAAGAGLMVLVEQPEDEDRDSLLTGPQGRMLRALLTALGREEADTYFASALPRSMPLPDWAALAADGLAELTAHHVSLVRPKRLLVFGNNVSSLLGNDPANSGGFLPNFDHEGPRIPALVAPALAALAARPRGKARLWQALLDWTAAD
jgi:DNA polymerase